MADIVPLDGQREPVRYTIHVDHHWDGAVDVAIEDISADKRSLRVAAYALKLARRAVKRELRKAKRA